MTITIETQLQSHLNLFFFFQCHVRHGTYCIYFQGDFATVRYWLIQQLDFQQYKEKYRMDVMGGGGRGFQDNVHWTLFKIFLICRRPLKFYPFLFHFYFQFYFFIRLFIIIFFIIYLRFYYLHLYFQSLCVYFSSFI